MEAPLIELDRVEKDYATGAVVVRALVDVSLSMLYIDPQGNRNFPAVVGSKSRFKAGCPKITTER